MINVDMASQITKRRTWFFAADNDEAQFFAFLFCYFVLWGLLAGLQAPAYNDSIEQVVWSNSWQWGYYKHPPLPSLLLYVLNHVFAGPTLRLTLFAALGCNVVALIYVWLLARQMLSQKLAMVAVLITSLISYHHLNAAVFNHNTVSMPVTAMAWYYFYGAIHSPEKLTGWLKLGIVCGLAMLVKYSAVLVFASFFVYLLWQRLWLNAVVIRGALVSMLVFLLVFYPNLQWLLEHDWLPFTYLDSYLDEQQTSLFGRLNKLRNFFQTQVLRLSPLLVAVCFLAKISPSRKPEYQDDNTQQGIPAFNIPDKGNKMDSNCRFLLVMLFTPLVLAVLPLLLSGSFLGNNWVGMFFLPSGILLVSGFLHQHNEARLLLNTKWLVWTLQLLFLLIFLGINQLYPAITGKNTKTNFSDALLAEKVAALWQQHQSEPLTILIANTSTGGNVLLYARPEPLLLIHNNPVIAPWVNRQDVASCGAFVLVEKHEANLPEYVSLFQQATLKGTFLLPWGHANPKMMVQYAWAIISPEVNQPECRFK